MYEPTARHQCVGDIAAALVDDRRANRHRDTGHSRRRASEFFYRITGGDPHGDTATIALAARSPQATAQGGYAELERTVVWIHRDWRMQLPATPPHLTGLRRRLHHIGDDPWLTADSST